MVPSPYLTDLRAGTESVSIGSGTKHGEGIACRYINYSFGGDLDERIHA
jgi:hypothetical protein